MTNPAAGLFKQVAYKKESSYGTIAGASGAQALRRVSSTLDLSKDTYLSQEIKRSMQKSDFRHGVRRGSGKLTGDLQCATHADFFAHALKRDFAALAAMTGLAITIAGTGPTYTVSRGAGSWLTAGVKVGMVGRLSAGTFDAANASKNLLVTAVDALDLTVVVLNGSELVAEGPIASSTFTVVGKSTYIPQSGHTDTSFSIEHWHSDVSESEVFVGCQVGQIALQLPPTGMAQIELDVMAKDIVTDSAQYFTSPTAETSTTAMAAVNGVLRVGGQAIATVTGLNLSIKLGRTGDPVVGSNVVPFKFPGGVDVSGQLTAYFDDPTLRDAFIDETEVDLIACFTADNSAAADFLAIVLPRVKLGGASKNDGEGGLIQTIPFQALEPLTGGSGVDHERTTIMIQDAQA